MCVLLEPRSRCYVCMCVRVHAPPCVWETQHLCRRLPGANIGVSMWLHACVCVSFPVLIKSVPTPTLPPSLVWTNTNIPRIKASLERHLMRTTVNWSLQYSSTHTHVSAWPAHAHTNTTDKAKLLLLFHLLPPPFLSPLGNFLLSLFSLVHYRRK